MLSPLQTRVALLVADLTESFGFVLAGGGALVARGEVERTTRDLDYFATRPEQVFELLPVLEQALRDAGLQVDTVRSAEGFARLLITDGDASTELDLASDFRLLPPERTACGFDRLLAAQLDRFDRLPAASFRLPADAVERLRHKVRTWQEHLRPPPRVGEIPGS